MYLHGANFSLPHLLNWLRTCSPQTYRGAGRCVPSCSGAQWRWLPDHGCRAGNWSGGRSTLFGCGEGKELQEEKIPPLGLVLTRSGGAEGLHIQHEFFLTFFCVLELLKFLVPLKLALRIFVVAAVVCSLYMLSDPLKTHTKPGALLYWVLLKCSPMPQ